MNINLNKEEVSYLIDLLPTARENAGFDGDRPTFDLVSDLLDKLGWDGSPGPTTPMGTLVPEVVTDPEALDLED